MLTAGLSNREIAERCSISTSTVKTHTQSIFCKLGVGSRTQAIVEGKKLDLIQVRGCVRGEIGRMGRGEPRERGAGLREPVHSPGSCAV